MWRFWKMKMKKDLSEVITAIEKFETDNIDYIDNSGVRWLDFAKIRIGRLYGLSEKDIDKIIFKK